MTDDEQKKVDEAVRIVMQSRGADSSDQPLTARYRRAVIARVQADPQYGKSMATLPLVIKALSDPHAFVILDPHETD